jgi:2-phospho-L-lactate guanylyltransferase (CobY/MobA/RfbA family)
LEAPLDQNSRCAEVARNTQRLREAVEKVMDDNPLDALVHSDIDLKERSEREQAVAQSRVVAQFGGGARVADGALFENVDAVGERQ